MKKTTKNNYMKRKEKLVQNVPATDLFFLNISDKFDENVIL